MLLTLFIHVSIAMFWCRRRHNKEQLIPEEPPAPKNPFEAFNKQVKCVGNAGDAKVFLATEYGLSRNVLIQCFETIEDAREVWNHIGNSGIIYEKNGESGEVHEKETGWHLPAQATVREAVRPYFRDLSKRANKPTLQLTCANPITIEDVNHAILQQDAIEGLMIQNMDQGMKKVSGNPYHCLATLTVEKTMQLNADDIQSEVITTISHRMGEGMTKSVNKYELDGNKLNIFMDIEILKPMMGMTVEKAYEGSIDKQKRVFEAIGCA